MLEWALLLPLAIPAYIIAYTYTGMLDVAGPLQSALREAFEWRYGDYWFPEIRSLGGAIVDAVAGILPLCLLVSACRVCRTVGQCDGSRAQPRLLAAQRVLLGSHCPWRDPRLWLA